MKEIPLTAGLLLGAAVLVADPPTPASPGNYERFATIVGSSPTFSWGGVPDASAYELAVFGVDELNLAPETLEPVFRIVLEGAPLSWTPGLDERLSAGGGYAWAVRSVPRLCVGTRGVRRTESRRVQLKAARWLAPRRV